LQAQTTRKQPKKAAPLPVFEPVAEPAPAPASDLNQAWVTAVTAAEEKQAVDIHVLDLRGVTSMTDIFFICHGRNSRQNQAICDEIERRLKEEHGERPISIEGLTNAEWILMDYGDMVFHIFGEAAREYYDLERLYRDARRLR
jgi:ribosome-associated protein